MRKLFYLLFVLILTYLVGCDNDAKNNDPVLPPEAQKPDTVNKPEIPECAFYDPRLYLFVIDKDSNNLLDATYEQTGIKLKDKIYVEKACMLDSHIYENSETTLVDSYLMIDTQIDYRHGRYFVETGDSAVITPTYKIPVLEYYTQLKMDWNNGDKDTFDIRMIDVCGIKVGAIRYKGSVIGISNATLIKEIRTE